MNSPANTILLVECSAVTARPQMGAVTDQSTAFGNFSAATEGFALYTFSHFPYPNTGGQLETGFFYQINGPIGSGGFTSATGRHSEGSNYLLSDDHVKWLRGSQVSQGNGAPYPQAPQADNTAEGTQNGSHPVTFSPT